MAIEPQYPYVLCAVVNSKAGLRAALQAALDDVDDLTDFDALPEGDHAGYSVFGAVDATTTRERFIVDVPLQRWQRLLRRVVAPPSFMERLFPRSRLFAWIGRMLG